MNDTSSRPAKQGVGNRSRSRDADLVVERILTSQREFLACDTKAHEWIESAADERQRLFELNRHWFTVDGVHESSVFLYYDLSDDPAVLERATAIQNLAFEVLGGDNFNPAPVNRLHSTILTDVVLPGGRLADSEVQRVADKHRELYQRLRPCLVFVLGPHLTPGGIILECRIHEPTLFDMRTAAQLLARDDSHGIPRIPRIEYATLGYVTGGEQARLSELNEALGRLGGDLDPIAVSIDRLLVTLTVNKSIVPPTLEFRLTAVPDAAAIDTESPGLDDPLERSMLEQSHRFASDSPSLGDRGRR